MVNLMKRGELVALSRDEMLPYLSESAAAVRRAVDRHRADEVRDMMARYRAPFERCGITGVRDVDIVHAMLGHAGGAA